MDRAFHDPARKHRVITGNQITLSFWLGFEDFIDVNPLFGVNPFATPFVNQTGGTPTSPFTPTTPAAPNTFPFVPTQNDPPVDTVNEFVGIIGFLAEVHPFETLINNSQMNWSLGARFSLENRMESFPFSREEWRFQLATRLVSTPLFSNRLAFQARFLTGFGHREWVADDSLWANTLELEGNARFTSGSPHILFGRGIFNLDYEEDGALATLGMEGQLGYRRLGEPTSLIDEMRFYGLVAMADRRDYESVADLQEESMLLGVGGEARIGFITFTFRFGYYLYERLDLKPIIIPPTFGTSPFFPPNYFAGQVLNPTFTEIDTGGFYFTVGIRAEF